MAAAFSLPPRNFFDVWNRPEMTLVAGNEDEVSL
jgi:hypothetical protein